MKCSRCRQQLNSNLLCWNCDAACSRCQAPKKEHYLVNYADGPHIGVSILICPTSTFEDSGDVYNSK